MMIAVNVSCAAARKETEVAIENISWGQKVENLELQFCPLCPNRDSSEKEGWFDERSGYRDWGGRKFLENAKIILFGEPMES